MSVFGYLKRKLQKQKERVEKGETGFEESERRDVSEKERRRRMKRIKPTGTSKKLHKLETLKGEDFPPTHEFEIPIKRTKEEEKKLIEAIHKQDIKEQKKEMLKEARIKRRVKGLRGGRRVSERKGIHKDINYPFNKRTDNTTLKSAQYIAKNRANAVRVEEVYHKEDNIHTHFFYDSNDDQVATYILEEKRFFYSDREQQKKTLKGITEKKVSITRAEHEDPEFQLFVKKLTKRRFHDVPSLLGLKVRREIGEELPPHAGAISVPHKQVFDMGANIIIGTDYEKRGSDLKMILTHELTHERRRSAGEYKPYGTEADKEEVETELESIQRGSIVDYGMGHYAICGGYWGEALGQNWRIWQKQDYETLMKRKAPRDYFELIVPSTRKISSNILLRKRDTNFWNAGVRKGGLEKVFEIMEKDGEDKAIPRIIAPKKRTKNMITGRAENIDMSFITSEGDYLHSFSPTGKTKPIDVARFLDRSDRVTGEEDIWQIMDRGKKLLISDKGTPDRIVKKRKKPTVGKLPEFKQFKFPTINLPFTKITQKSECAKADTNKKTKQKKHRKNTINEVLSFRFFS